MNAPFLSVTSPKSPKAEVSARVDEPLIRDADAADDDFDLGRVAEIDAQDGCLRLHHGY